MTNTTIPDAAVDAAETGIEQARTSGLILGDAGILARAAIEAAMPAIRESLLREASDVLPSEWYEALAARIVRGGTP